MKDLKPKKAKMVALLIRSLINIRKRLDDLVHLMYLLHMLLHVYGALNMIYFTVCLAMYATADGNSI